MHEVFASLSASVAKLSFKNVWQVILLYGKPHNFFGKHFFLMSKTYFHVPGTPNLTRAHHRTILSPKTPIHFLVAFSLSFICSSRALIFAHFLEDMPTSGSISLSRATFCPRATLVMFDSRVTEKVKKIAPTNKYDLRTTKSRLFAAINLFAGLKFRGCTPSYF